MRDELLTIQEAADFFGVSTRTLRRWEQKGYLVAQRTFGNQRRYSKNQLAALFKMPDLNEPLKPQNEPVPAPQKVEWIGAQPQQHAQPTPEPVKEAAVIEAAPVEHHAHKTVHGFQMPNNDEDPEYGGQQRVVMVLASAVAVLLVFVLSAVAFANLGNLGKGRDGFVNLISKKNNSSSQTLGGKSVLAAETHAQNLVMNINVPSIFGKRTTFLDNVEIKKSLTTDGLATLKGGVVTQNANINAGTGTVTASNLVYSVIAGSNISITGDPQNPTISADLSSVNVDLTNTVSSLQGQTGALNFTQGDGIALSGFTITNSDPGSAQKIFGTFSVGGTDIAAGSNTDTLTFAAGSGINLTPDAGSKTITITSTANGTLSGLTTYGVLYATASDNATSTDAGVSGYVLKSNGPSTAPEWVAPGTLLGFVPFDFVTSGTNTTAAMVVGSGASLSYTGTGTIAATSLLGSTWAAPGAIGSTTPSTGAFTTLTANTINGLTVTSNGTNTLTIATGKTFTVNNTLTLAGTDGTSFTLPSASDTLVGQSSTDTLTNKTITAGSNTITGLTNANLSGTAGITNANLANSSVTVTAGTGMSGGGAVSLGGSVTLNNAGVTSVAGTANQVNVSAGTGAVTFSLPQNIDSGASPTFTGLTLSALTTNGGLLYTNGTGTIAQTIAGNPGQCLTSSGGGSPTWATCAASNYWQLASGALSPINSTTDLLIGGTATASAKFAFINTIGSGTPTASISAGTANNAAYLAGNGVLGTTNAQTLTIGSPSTGNVVIDAGSGQIILSDNASIAGNLNLLTGNAFQINGTSVLNGTTLGSGVTASSLTSVGALASGSIANGFGTIFTANTIQGSNITASGTTGYTASGNGAGLIFSGTGNHDITASSGTLRFGDVTLSGVVSTGLTGNNSALYATSGTGTLAGVSTNTANQCLLSGASNPVWGNCALGTNYFQLNNGAVSPFSNTADLLIGGTATASAKFAFINAATGTPTASISGSVSGAAMSLTGDGVLSTTQNRSLIINPNGGNVGIGTANPKGTFDVAGLINASGTVGAMRLNARDLSANYYDLYSATGELTFYGGQGIRATMTSGGLFGLGLNNTNPLATLDVRGVSGTLPFASFTGSTAQAGLAVDNSGVGDIITASASGTTRLTLSNGGNLNLIGGVFQSSGVSGITQGTASCVTTTGGIVTGFGTCQLGSEQWEISNGAIYTGNPSLDLLLGGTSTASARFAVTNISGGTPTASVSAGVAGGTSMAANGIIGTSSRQTLTLGSSSTGNVVLAPAGATALTALANGNVGIGTTNPGDALSIYRSGAALIKVHGTGDSFNYSGLLLSSDESSDKSWDILHRSGAGEQNNFAIQEFDGTNYNQRFVIKPGGNIGIGTITPIATLDVRGNSGTASVASLSGQTAIASFIVDNTGVGDLFAASKSGATKFVVMNNGNIGVAANQTIDTLTSGTLGIGTGNATTLTLGRSGQGITLPGFNNCGMLTTTGTALTCGSAPAGSTQYLRLNNGAFSLVNDTADFLYGNVASTSAKFKLSVSGTAPTASVAGSTSNAAMVVDNTGVGDLFTASKSGATKFVIKNNGNVGIGTATPDNALDVAGIGEDVAGFASLDSNDTNVVIGGNDAGRTGEQYISYRNVDTANNAWMVGMDDDEIFGWDFGSAGEILSRLMSLTQSGSLGLGMEVPLATFDARGNSGTTPVASISGQTANAAMMVDNNGVGDLFVASKSGATKFAVHNNGNIGLAANQVIDTLTAGTLGIGTGNATTLTLGRSGQSIALPGFNNCTMLTTTGTALTCGTAPTVPSQYLRLNNGAFSLVNDTADFLFGNAASTSAKFKLSISGNGPTASVAGATSFAAFAVDNTGSGDLFTASKSGATKFTILNNGNIQMNNYTGQNGVLYGTQNTGVLAQATTASAGQCLLSGASAPTWGSCTTSTTFTQNSGLIYAGNTTVDFALGGNSTASAQFSVTGMNGGAGSLGNFATNTNALPALRNGQTSVAANGYVYIIGGYNGTSSQSTVYYSKINADGSLSNWVTNANALPAIRNGHSSVVANGYIYVLGGYDDSVLQNTVYYAKLNPDGSTGPWVTNANTLPATRYLATSTVVNGYIYYIGGDNSSAVPQTSIYYAKLNADGSTGGWQTNSSNPLPGARDSAATVTANGFIYVIGGYNGTSPQTQVYYARANQDGSIAAWQTSSANPLPAGRSGHSAVVANGYIYAMGGYDGSLYRSTVYYAKLNEGGTTDAWQTNTYSLPANRSAGSSVMANGYVYFMGGYNGSASQSTVYYASTARVSMLANLDLIGLAGGSLASASGYMVGNGSLGGSIFAGNIYSNGSLEIAGNTNLWGGLAVYGNQTLTGGLNVLGSNGGTPAASISATTATAALVVDNNGVGDLFTASKSGATKFVVQNNGNIGVAANQVLDTLTSGTFGIGTTNATTLTLGRSGQGITLPAFSSCGMLTTSGTALTCSAAPAGSTQYLRLNNGAFSFVNDTTDFLFGNVASTSAKFKLSVSGTAPTASVAGSTSNAALMVDNTGRGDLFTASKSGSTKFTIKNDGRVVIGNDPGSTNPNEIVTVRNVAGRNTDLSLEDGNGTNRWSIYASVTGETGFYDSSNAKSPFTIEENTPDSTLYLDSTGNVGFFGNNTPNQAIDIGVNGIMQMNSGQIQDYNDLTLKIDADNNGTNIMQILNGAGGQIMKLNESGQMTLNNTGNLLSTLDVRAASGTLSVGSVSGATSFAALVADNSGTGDLFTASKSGATKFVVQNNGNIGIGANQTIDTLTAGTLGIGVGNATTLTLGRTGQSISLPAFNNCGMLTTTGTALTCSASPTSTTYLRLNQGAFSLVNDTADFLFGGSASTSAKFRLSSSGTSAVASISGQTSHAALYINNSGTGDLFTASRAGETKFVIDNLGRVGIGLPNPQSDLEVSSTVSPLLDLNDGSDYQMTVRHNAATNGAGAGIGFTVTNTTGNIGAAIIHTRTNSNSMGNLGFYTKRSTTVGADPTLAMLIDDQGRVGVGTGTPDNALTVNGNFNVRDADTPTKSYRYRTNGSFLDFEAGGADLYLSTWSNADYTGSQYWQFIFDSAGGDISAERPMDVNYIADSATYSLSVGGGISFAQWSSAIPYTLFNNVDTGAGFSFKTSNAAKDLLVLEGDGRVGVGVPIGQTAKATFDVRGQTGNMPVASFSGSTNKAALQVDNNGTGDLFTASKSGATKFVIDNSGNVGIGTAEPSEKLDVSGGNIKATGTVLDSQGFEGVTFAPASPGTWTTGGSASWTRETTNCSTTAEGSACARAPTSITDSQSSWLDVNYTFNRDGAIKFNWKVSSEDGYDHLVICVDNDSNCDTEDGFVKRISGIHNWEEITIPVKAGTHSFRWHYGKDGSTTANTDVGWVDNVRFFEYGNISAEGSVYAGGDLYAGNRAMIGTPSATTSPDATLDVWGDLKLGASSEDAIPRWRIFATGERSTTNSCDTGGSSGNYYFCIDSDDDADTSELRLNEGGALVHAGTISSSGNPDIAEQFPVDDTSIDRGEILVATSGAQQNANREYDKVMTTRAREPYQQSIIGIVSTDPTMLIGEENAMNLGEDERVINGNRRAVALAGRVPLKVSTVNGPIKPGDPITSSMVPGYGMRATEAGPIVGTAMQYFDPARGMGSVVPCPAGTQSDVTCGTIIVHANLSYYDGGSKAMAKLGDSPSALAQNIPSTAVRASNYEGSNVFDAGVFNARVATSSAMFDLNNKVENLGSQLGAITGRIASLETLASGSAFTSAPPGSFNASSSAELGLDKLDVKDATVTNTLAVLGRTTLTDVGITGNVNIGVLSIEGLDDDGMAAINTTSGPLKLQSSGFNGIDILDGKMTVDTKGNLKTEGTVTAKKINIETEEVASASIGEAVLKAGQTKVVVTTKALTDKSKIFTQPKELPVTTAVKKVGVDKFEIRIREAETTDVKLDWWIIN